MFVITIKGKDVHTEQICNKVSAQQAVMFSWFLLGKMYKLRGSDDLS